MGDLINIDRLEGILDTHEKRLSLLEKGTGKRQRPSQRVINTHRAVVKSTYGDKCPCCLGPLEIPEIDHFFNKSWAGVHDTWMICSKCNSDLYHGNLIRSEILPRFSTYQSHLKNYLGGTQLTLIPMKADFYTLSPIQQGY